MDNSPWSPSIKGITETRLGKRVEVIANRKQNKFHATALDQVVEDYDFDYLFALETDVAVLRHGWLPWFMENLERDAHWAMVGHWHHEGFINPSCTLYRGSVLKDMLAWCKSNKSQELRWGDNFEKTAPLNWNLQLDPEETKASALDWLSGPFAEKRGWPEGTVLNERPSGQSKGPGWFEPGQQLYHWARQNTDWGYLALPTFDYLKSVGWPIHTYYGCDMPARREYEIKELFTDNGPYCCHFWRGTGALNLIKHPLYSPEDHEFMNWCLPREGRFWMQAVDPDVRADTLALIKKHRWHTASCLDGGPVTDRDRAAVEIVENLYRQGGVPL